MDQRKLLASILAGRPIGSLLFVRQIVRENGANYLADRYVCGLDGKAQGDSPVGFILDGQQRIRTIFEGFASVADREPGRPPVFGLRRIWFLDLDLFLGELSEFRGAVDRSVALERSISFKYLKNGVAHSEYLDQCVKAARLSNREPIFILPLGLLVCKKNEKQRELLKSILSNFVNARAGKDKSITKKLLCDLENVFTTLEREKCDAIEASSVYERINATGKDLETWHIASAHLFARSQPCRDLLARLEGRFAMEQGEFVDGQAGLVGIGQQDLLLAAIHAGSDLGDYVGPLDAETILAAARSESGIAAISRGLDRIDEVAAEVAILLEENGVRRRAHWPAPIVSIALLAAIARASCAEDILETGSIRRGLRRWWWERSLGSDSIAATNTALPKLFHEATQICAGKPYSQRAADWSLAAFGVNPSTVRSGSKAKALCALLRIQGLRDFRSWHARGHRQKLDLHHIFPRKWLRDHGRDDGDCFGNLTLVTADTNRDYIRAKGPSQYVEKIIADNRGSGDPRAALSEVLSAHGIEIDCLQREDFDAFLEARLKWFDKIFAQLGVDLAV